MPSRAIAYRPMEESDVGGVPIVHQGGPRDVRRRIRDLGSSAILAFDGDEHVAQLQFRRYAPGTRSSGGVWDPLWWMDFESRTPELSTATLSICCIHVGQRDHTDLREERYQGRGIGSMLLDTFLAWATNHGFATVTAKAVPADTRIMRFLGGLSPASYEHRGFDLVAEWNDPHLDAVIRDQGLMTEDASRVSCYVRTFE